MAAQEYYDSFKTNPAIPTPQYPPNPSYGGPPQVLHPGPGYSDVSYKQAYPPQQPQQYPPREARPPPAHRPYYTPQHHSAQPIPQSQYLQPLPPLRPERSISEPPRHEHHHHRHRHHSRPRERSRSRSDSRSHSRERSRDLSRTRSNEHSSRSRGISRTRSHDHSPRSRDMPSELSRARSYDHDRSRDRSRSRTRSHRKKEKESTTNTFLGAFGGGAIGDLIFPGLGTVGGALLGGWGGHEVGKGTRDGGSRGRHKRDRYDEEWEEGCRRRGEIP